MFWLFRSKPNYEEIFASQEKTRSFIYADRAKTSSILGDNSFIEAWLDSRNVGQVTAVIEHEAMQGDIPSLKQMIWVSDAYFEDATNNFKDRSQLLEMQTMYLQDRIKYCSKAIEVGLKDQSYYALVSSVKLYKLYEKIPLSNKNSVAPIALQNIIKFSDIFIKSGVNEPELIQDAKNAIAHYGPMAKLLGTKF